MITITSQEFKQLADYIRMNYGIYLKETKKSLVSGRLYNVLQEKGLANFTEYYQYLINDKTGDAITTLLDKITTNHTYFMREVEHFYFFQDKVLPYLKSVIKDKDLRIWSAACSTGEEPYNLAILIDEFFGREKIWWDTKILATDISTKVLDIAVKGVYSKDKVLSLPEKWQRKYFEMYNEEELILKEKIRQEVIFRKFNLMERMFPFKRKFHVIFCRNVMIYFDAATKKELVNKFFDMLESGGFLFIGHSESLHREATKFKYIMPAVYRKE